jgi:hypothetical protein
MFPGARERGPTRRVDALALASLSLYAALCLATALVWEPAHDEGTTWEQAVARLPLAPGEAVPIERLYALAAGAQPRAPGEVLDALRAPDAMHPPAYYLLMSRWIPATGGRQPWLALPAVALGAAALLAMRRVAERVAPGPGAGDRAMALLAVSPWLVGHTVLARPYAAALAIALLATAALLRSLEGPPAPPMPSAGRGPDRAGRTRSRVLFVALSILGLYTIYHYAFVVAWQLALLAAHTLLSPPAERRGEIRALLATAAAIAAGYAPWLPSLAAHLEVTRAPWYFSGTVPAGEWPRALGLLLSALLLGEERGTFGRPVLELSLALLGALTLALAARSFAGGRAPQELPPLAAEGRAARAFWWTAPLLPALVAAADLWHGTHTLLVAKTGFVLPVLLVLLVVRASHRASGGGPHSARLRLAARPLRDVPAPRALVAAWAALALAANASAIAALGSDASPIRRVASHLRERAEPGHLVVVSSPRPTYVYPLLLALRDAGVAEVRVMYAPPELLAAEGAGLAARAGATSLSLVNLAVRYDPASVWSRELLRDIAGRAREAGFAVARVRASTPRGAGERRLYLLSPVQVRYFPG